MYCRNCGNIIDNQSTTCQNCGANPSTGINYCPNCGHFCIPGDTQCVQCGVSLIGSGFQTMQQGGQTTTPSSSKTIKYLTPDKKYCRNCGLVIPAGAQRCEFCEAQGGFNYCPKCGSGTTDTDSVCSVCATPLHRIQTNYIPGPPPAQQTQTSQQPTYTINNNEDDDRSDFLVTLLLNIFLGYMGVHRFYTGHVWIGVIQFLTGGGCGVWYMIDMIMIAMGSYTDARGRKLKR